MKRKRTNTASYEVLMRLKMVKRQRRVWPKRPSTLIGPAKGVTVKEGALSRMAKDLKSKKSP